MASAFSYLDRTHQRDLQSVSRQSTNEIGGVTRRTQRDLGDVDERIDRLTLLCEAMWQLVEEHSDLELADLEQRIDQLDQTDGRRDLRRQRTAVPCECGAMVPVTALSCYFCAAPAMRNSPFDMV